MAYPASLDSFTPKVDGVDDVMAAHVNDLQASVVAIETELGTDPAGSATNLVTRLANGMNAAGYVKGGPGTTLTISAGAITITGNYHKVETEGSAASDDLDTINGGATGLILFLQSVNDARNVVIKHGTGNIYCAGAKDITLDTNYEIALLVYDNANTRWIAGKLPPAFSIAGNITGDGVLATGGFTLTVPATGTAALGTGTADKVAGWSDANTLEDSGIAVADVMLKSVNALTVEEVDESPSVAEVNKIIFPNGSVTDNVDGSVSIDFPSVLIVQEIDEVPSVSGVNKINVTNGTLTNVGSGEITIDFGSAATDGSAIHDNVADEISAITEKVTLVDDDLFLIEDSEALGVKKKVKVSNLPISDIGVATLWDAKGDLAVGTGANTASRLGVGTDGQVVTADSAEETGMKWATPDVAMENPMTTAGDIIIGGASGAPTRLAAGTEDYVLTMGATNPEWAPSAGGSGGGIPDNGWVDASETWTYASADDPTFTFTVAADVTAKYSAGMRIKLTQTTVKYFIITKVGEFAGTTPITVYGGTDYDLIEAVITDNYYSVVKSPHGFPLDSTKWEVKLSSSTAYPSQANPTAGTWYNINSNSLSIPIGLWNVSYVVGALVENSTVGATVYLRCCTGLSTENNSQGDIELFHLFGGTGMYRIEQIAGKEKQISISSKTTYYLNLKVLDTNCTSLMVTSPEPNTLIKAVCAYL